MILEKFQQIQNDHQLLLIRVHVLISICTLYLVFDYYKILSYGTSILSFFKIWISPDIIVASLLVFNLIFIKIFSISGSTLWQKLTKYSIYLLLSLIISHFIVFTFGFKQNNPESTRYLLSALIQSEAAILAIVISLTLIAVQQASSTYSPRVIDIFKNKKQNPDFYIITTTYIIAIIYGSWVLKQIRTEEGVIQDLNCIIFSSFESHIWLTYAIGIFSLAVLIPYTLHTLSLLNPNIIIDKLSMNINKNEMKKDLILPIIDIIRKSLIEHDYETAQYGLETLTYRVIPLLSDENLSKEHKEILFELFFKHFMKVARVAISKKDEIFVINLLETVERIIPLRIEDSTSRKAPIALIEEIGVESANQRLESASIKAIDLLDELFSKIPDEKVHDEILIDIFSALKSIGTIVAEHKMKRSSSHVLTLLGKIIERAVLKDFGTQDVTSKKYIEHKQRWLMSITESFFRSFSDIAFENNSKYILINLSLYLMKNGKHIIAKKWDDNFILLVTLDWLVEIGEFATDKKYMKELERTNISHIQVIYSSAMDYNNCSIALAACEAELKLKPNSHKAWIRKGDALLKCGGVEEDYVDAEGAYVEANKIKQSWKGWNGIIESRYAMGNSSGAEEIIEKRDLWAHFET